MQQYRDYSRLRYVVILLTTALAVCHGLGAAEMVDDSTVRIEPPPRKSATTISRPADPLTSDDILTAIDWTTTPYPVDHLGGAALGNVRPPFSYLGDEVGLFEDHWLAAPETANGVFSIEDEWAADTDDEFNTSNLLDSNDDLFELINDLRFDKNKDATEKLTGMQTSAPEDSAPEEETVAARLVFPNKAPYQNVNSPEDQLNVLGEEVDAIDSPLYAFRRYLSSDTPPEEWQNANLFIMAVVGACGVLVMLMLPTEPKVVPTRGQVLYNDKPLTTGVVMFQPEVGPTAHAKIQPDGSFVLQTPGRGRGTSIGKNRVKVLCFVGQGPDEIDIDPEQLVLGRSHIPKKFADYETSGLSVTIHPRGNRPFIIQLAD